MIIVDGIVSISSFENTRVLFEAYEAISSRALAIEAESWITLSLPSYSLSWTQSLTLSVSTDSLVDSQDRHRL